MDEETTDVNNADETTASESSNTEETLQNTTEVEEVPSEDLKTVPYSRLQEVIEERNRYKAEAEARNNAPAPVNASPETLQVKETLKGLLKEVAPELGFVSKEELRQEKQDEALERDLKKLEKEWDGTKDPSLKFSRKEVIAYALERGIGDPEAAFQLMKQKELINYHIRTAQAKGTGLQTEGSNGSGASNVGSSNEDLKDAIKNGDKGAYMALLKRQMK